MAPDWLTAPPADSVALLVVARAATSNPPALLYWIAPAALAVSAALRACRLMAVLALPLLLSVTVPPASTSVLTFSAPAVTLPVPAVCVTAPSAVRSSVPVPTLDAVAPTPRLTAPVLRTKALALPVVLTLRLVAATSMPSLALVPIWPLALSVMFCAVMVCAPPSLMEPALSVNVLPARLTAPPIVMTPVLAVSPMTIGPVAPVAMAVSSAAERSKTAAPASDMARLAVLALSVSTPLVARALFPAFAAMATVSAVTVMGPLPAHVDVGGSACRFPCRCRWRQRCWWY
jgi:hypothetical protein